MNRSNFVQILTFENFLNRVNSLDHISDAYDVFEFECTDSVRDQVYAFADVDSTEPFRSAMHNLGFKSY